MIDGKSLFERNHDVMARLAAHHPRDMAMPGGIVGEHDVARPEAPYGAIASFDLDLSGERDDVLALRRGVIIAQMGCRGVTKDYSVRRLEFGSFHLADEFKFHVDVFEVRFVIRSCEKSNDLHMAGCKGISRENQEARNLTADKLARQTAEEKIEKFEVKIWNSPLRSWPLGAMI
jgi:hypothetical protein